MIGDGTRRASAVGPYRVHRYRPAVCRRAPRVLAGTPRAGNPAGATRPRRWRFVVNGLVWIIIVVLAIIGLVVVLRSVF